jgi:hypothetical protein
MKIGGCLIFSFVKSVYADFNSLNFIVHFLQTHCYSENLVALEIEPGTSVTAARNSDHHTTETQKVNLEIRLPCPSRLLRKGTCSFTSDCPRTLS